MLGGLGAIRTQFDRLAQDCLGLLQQFRILVDAAKVLKRHQPVLGALGRDRRRRFEIGPPFLDGQRDLAGVLEGAAEIDMRRAERRLDEHAGAQGVDRPREVAEFTQRHRMVEPGEMDELVLVVIGDPELVKIGRLLRQPKGLQALRRVDEVAEGEFAAPDARREIEEGRIGCDWLRRRRSLLQSERRCLGHV